MMNSKLVYSVACLLLAGITETRSQDLDSLRPGGPGCVFAPLSSYQCMDVQRFEKNFIWALESPVDQVLESVIREISRVKLAQPHCHSEAIRERLDDLAANGNTPCVRYKATLAGLLFAMPELFVKEGLVEYTTGEELFTAVARRLETELLATTVP